MWRCSSRFTNQGSVHTTSIATRSYGFFFFPSLFVTQSVFPAFSLTRATVPLTPSGSQLAIGNDSGIVNLYNLDSLNTPEPLPVKSFDQLTTAISSMLPNTHL